MTKLRAALFAMALAALFLAPYGVQAAEADCPPAYGTRVRVNPIFSPNAVNDNVDLRGLRGMAEDGKTKTMERSKRHHPLGMHTTELMMETDYEISALTSQSGTCAQISEINIDIWFRNNTIFIARELPRNSCAYREVMAHEEKHLNTDWALLREFTPTVEKRTKQLMKEIGFVRGTSTQDIERQISARVSPFLTALKQEIDGIRAARQSLIDTPEEYRRVTMSCDGEIVKILRNKLGEKALYGLD